MHRLYDHVRGWRIRRSRGQLFFGSMARSPVLVCSRATAGMDSVAVGSGRLNMANLQADYIFAEE